MAEYVEREKLAKHFECCIDEVKNTGGVTKDFEICLKALKNQPAADIVQISSQLNHGCWIFQKSADSRDKFYKCSKCGRTINVICGESLDDYPYCHCGACMTIENEKKVTSFPSNHMKVIAEMLGVELNERFDLLRSNGMINSDCYINEFGLQDSCNDALPESFLALLQGRAEVIKKLFRPREGEIYYHVDVDYTRSGLKFSVNSSRFRQDNIRDLVAVDMGNCFCTYEAAEAHMSEIVAKLEVGHE